ICDLNATMDRVLSSDVNSRIFCVCFGGSGSGLHDAPISGILSATTIETNTPRTIAMAVILPHAILLVSERVFRGALDLRTRRDLDFDVILSQNSFESIDWFKSFGRCFPKDGVQT
ncbi:MAG: hypothetical protein RLZZ578_1251, partial [Bacteroidota bacterium]